MRTNAQGQNQNKLIQLGLIALIVANVGSYVIRRKLALPESISDPVSGLLLGVAIALLLVGLARQRRARDS